jgi:DNA polymerase III subunit epsilon
MKQVAVAFATTGPSPKQGHRISELVAVEQEDGSATGRYLHLQLRTADAQTAKPTFAEAFDALDELIGDAPIVVRHAGHWRKFIREELRSIKKRGARRLLTQTVDVSAWAHSRYPKQRKSLAAIAQRVGVVVSPELSGLNLETEQLRLIANAMKPSDAKPHAPATAKATPMIKPTSPEPKPARFSERVKLFWRSLVG